MNPASFSLSSLRKSVSDRGALTTSAEHTQQLFGSSQGESSLVDKIFEMSPEQLDAHFKSYVHAKNSFFSQMSLVQGDFEKLPSITKKKVLINMTGVRQLMATNPNPQVLEGKA